MAGIAGLGPTLSPLPAILSTVPDASNEISHPEQAKGKQEMFLAGATNGGVARAVLPQYPSKWTITELPSPFLVKRWWLYNEWHPKCQFSFFVRKSFPEQAPLHPETGTASKDLIETTFNEVRGKYEAIWGPLKENAKWTQVVVRKLKLKWVEQNVKLLYPTNDTFEVSELNGLVLWEKSDKKYDLVEGNHRVSAWMYHQKPESLPSILFIGRPC